MSKRSICIVLGIIPFLLFAKRERTDGFAQSKGDAQFTGAVGSREKTAVESRKIRYPEYKTAQENFFADVDCDLYKFVESDSGKAKQL